MDGIVFQRIEIWNTVPFLRHGYQVFEAGRKILKSESLWESGAIGLTDWTRKGTEMAITEISHLRTMDSTALTQSEKSAGGVERGGLFSKMLENNKKKCPYNNLAKDGVIKYNGVAFVCDYRSNSICLGDMSNPKEVLNISLPSGGNLKVNIHNFDDLLKASGMFTPEDLNAIMRAIAQYNHCTNKLNEIEEEKNKIPETT